MFGSLFGRETGSELLRRAYDNVMGMLRHERKMIEASMAYLFDGTEPVIDIRGLDKDMNVEERIIRRLVLEHLSFNPNRDLPASLVLVSIVHDVERIGDYAKGILGLVEMHGPIPADSGAVGRMSDLRDGLYEVYDLAQSAFEEEDVEKAVSCVQKHLDNQRLSKEVVEMVFADGTMDKNLGIEVSAAARMMRRTSAHLANIASSVSHPFDKIGGRADEAV